MIKLQFEVVDALTDLNEDEYFDQCEDVDEIEPLLHHDPSTPKISIAFILEGIAMDYEDSRARGFVHRFLELLPLACIWESDILDVID
nr:hypothetical protein [Tanacetum cinerariifolium]